MAVHPDGSEHQFPARTMNSFIAAHGHSHFPWRERYSWVCRIPYSGGSDPWRIRPDRLGGFKKRIVTTLFGIWHGVAVIVIGDGSVQFVSHVPGGIHYPGFHEVITNGPLIAILQSNVDPEKQAG